MDVLSFVFPCHHDHCIYPDFWLRQSLSGLWIAESFSFQQSQSRLRPLKGGPYDVDEQKLDNCGIFTGKVIVPSLWIDWNKFFKHLVNTILGILRFWLRFLQKWPQKFSNHGNVYRANVFAQDDINIALNVDSNGKHVQIPILFLTCGGPAIDKSTGRRHNGKKKNGLKTNGCSLPDADSRPGAGPAGLSPNKKLSKAKEREKAWQSCQTMDRNHCLRCPPWIHLG